MKRVVFVTSQYWGSKRKAGFHWLADAYARAGWNVLFFTDSVSRLSSFVRDYRSAFPVQTEGNRLIRQSDRTWSYLWHPLFHPANLRLPVLNRLSGALFQQYGMLPLGEAEERICDADQIVFESTPGLLLFDRFKRLNPTARYVYRVSDDLRILRNHPIVVETEDRIISQFDLVSVPSQYIYGVFDGLPQLRLHRHGIRKELFDRDYPNPYPLHEGLNLIFVGNFHFDHDAIDRASRMFPAWQFHVIGPIERVPKRENIIVYGEMPFAETIPYLKHADIGLQILRYYPGAECFTDSLKIMQYTYCRLPILAPEFLRSPRGNLCYYRLKDDDSIRSALEAASRLDRSRISTDGISSWDELVGRLNIEGNRPIIEEAATEGERHG